jgi:CRP/FNR family cyclic AMP-dependent transcriptional regulator
MRKVLFILSQLSDDDVEWLATHGVHQPCPAGFELIALGSMVDSVYFILEGSFGVYAPSGDKVVDLGSGEVLGEMSLVDPAPTTAAVRANIEGMVLRLDIAMLRAKLDQDMAFAAHMYRALAVFLADRIRGTTRRLGGGGAAEPGSDERNGAMDEPLRLAGLRFERLLRRLAS